MNKIIKRTRKNARKEFCLNGVFLPARFQYKVIRGENTKGEHIQFFPYPHEAYNFLNNH